MADELRGQKRVFLVSLLIGVAYGGLARLVFGLDRFKDVFGVMTTSFIFLIPFGLGMASVMVGERHGRWKWWQWIVIPWLAALLALGSALALAWEGIICIFLWVPLFLILSSLGGLAGALAGYFLRKRGKMLCLAVFLILPFVAAPLEHRIPLPDDRRVVRTEIEIAASPELVWQNIARVPAIRPEEQGPSLFHALGFPRPIEATLSHEGVGGVRHASFEGDVVFIETVTDWQPGRRLAFTIAADPESIPQTTLDEHVTVGGPFFDVLNGEYEIETVAPGRVVLHLASTHRLSTHFNLYSGIWTDKIMRDVQEYILEIIKRRCEAVASPSAVALSPKIDAASAAADVTSARADALSPSTDAPSAMADVTSPSAGAPSAMANALSPSADVTSAAADAPAPRPETLSHRRRSSHNVTRRSA